MDHPDYLRIPLAGYLSNHFGSESKQDIESLATELSLAFPQLVTVTRSGNWLSRHKTLSSLAVRIEDQEFHLKLNSSPSIEASVKHVVRGIVLSSDSVSLSSWLDRLAEALEEHARSHEQAQEALRRWMS